MTDEPEDLADAIGKHRLAVPGLGRFEWNPVREGGEMLGIQVRFAPTCSNRPLPGWMRFRIVIAEDLTPAWQAVADPMWSAGHAFPAPAVEVGRRIAEAEGRANEIGFVFQVLGAVRPEVNAYQGDEERLREKAHWLANRVMAENDPETRLAMNERLDRTRVRLERLQAEHGSRIAGLRRILDATLEWCMQDDSPTRHLPYRKVLTEVTTAATGPSPA